MFKRIALLTICLVVLFSFSQLLAQEATEDEEALRQALLDIAIAFENGDYAAIRSHIAENYVVHSPFGDLDWAAVEGLFTALSNALTDYNVARDPVLVEGNLTTTRTVVSGVFENEFAGPMGVFPPTGQPFTLEYINILQFDENGKVVEEWVQFDVLNFMTQLGAMGDATTQASEPACEGEYLESVRELGLTYIDALNAGHLDPWYEVLADDYQAFYLSNPPLDKDAARASDEALMATFPGFQTEVHMSTVSADCRFVTFHWTSRGTFAGPMGDIPPTGNSVEVPGMTIVEIEDGQIVSERVSYDLLHLMTQMGLMGDPAQAPDSP